MLIIKAVSKFNKPVGTTERSALYVDRWMARFNGPENFKVEVFDEHGELVGTKEFDVKTITWLTIKEKESAKGKLKLGCAIRSVSMDDATWLRAREIGGGNLSLGLRIAVGAYNEAQEQAE